MQYDSPVTGTAFSAGLADNATLANSTRDAISQILGLDTAESVNVASWNGSDDLIAPTGEDVDAVIVQVPGSSGRVGLTLPAEAMATTKAWIFETDADLDVRFNTVERVIASGNGNDAIEVAGDKNTTLDGGHGNDTLVTSGGNDSVSGGLGNDTISTGAGNDTVLAGEGADTVDAGAGFDVVQLAGGKNDWTFSLDGDTLVLTSNADAANSVAVRSGEHISFANADESLSIVSTDQQGTVMRLYQSLLGRDADVEGAQYWLDQLEQGHELPTFAHNFLVSAEWAANIGDVDNTQFLEMLYQQALGRNVDEVGLDYWLNDLANGQTRDNVTINIVGSAESAELITSVIVIDGLV